MLQNVILPLLIRGIPRDRAERLAMERIGQMRLEDRVRHKPSELSGGQQQRVAIDQLQNIIGEQVSLKTLLKKIVE